MLRYIRAAEEGDIATFSAMTRQSVEKTFAPPVIGDVDRTDERCRLHALDASIRMVSAVWNCPANTKQNVQRTFLLEAEHITAIWNDWAELPMVPADLPSVR